MITKFHVGRPYVHSIDDFIHLARDILDSRWLTNDGPTLRRFEYELSETLHVDHVIATCNATVGLQILLKALLGGRGGEVIVPAFTFAATAQAPLWIGLDPVIADVDLDTHCLSPAAVERCLTSKTRAILGVHLWGNPCNMLSLKTIAESAGVPLIFDAAHAFGGMLDGQSIGNFGAGEVFSFHATKFFNTFEGGAITTNDHALAATCRQLRNFGFTGLDQIESSGTNGKMSEICAAMGLVNICGVDALISINRQHYEIYAEQLGNSNAVDLYGWPNNVSPNYQYVVLRLRDDRESARDEAVARLTAEGILARRYFYPGLHRIPPFGSAGTPCSTDHRNTEKLAKSVFVLPTGPAMSPNDVKVVARAARRILEDV